MLLLFSTRVLAPSVVLLQSLVRLSEWLFSVGDLMGVGGGSGTRPSRRLGHLSPFCAAKRQRDIERSRLPLKTRIQL